MPKNVIFYSCIEPCTTLNPIIEELNLKGIHTKTVFLISISEYRNSKSFFTRLLLRFKMYVLYPIFLIPTLVINNNESVHVVTTNPFYTAFLFIIFKKKYVINLVWDLYPEVLNNGVNSPFFFTLLCEKIVRYIFKKSNQSVLLNNSTLNYVNKKYHLDNLYVIPVGTANRLFAEGSQLSLNGDNSLIYIDYCGNLGRMHDIDTFIKYLCIDSIGIDSIVFSFYSFGSSFKKLESYLSTCRPRPRNLNLHPSLSDELWVKRMTTAQVAFVTIAKDAETLIMPSKVYSALAAGQAILTVCSLGSDLANLIVENDCGWVVEHGDVHGLINALNEISNYKILLNKRKNSYKIGHGLYSADNISNAWIELFKKLN